MRTIFTNFVHCARSLCREREQLIQQQRDMQHTLNTLHQSHQSLPPSPPTPLALYPRKINRDYNPETTLNDDHHHRPPSHSASVAIAMQDDRARTPDDEDDDDDDEDDSMHNDIGMYCIEMASLICPPNSPLHLIYTIKING